MNPPEPIIYEQPVNEHMRVCLRLEHLFAQTFHWLRGISSWDSRATLAAILEILNVLDRPDLKTKLVKELSRYATALKRYMELPNIDRSKLVAIQRELDHTLRNLHSVQGRIAQTLRDNDFLTTIRQHLLSPGGGCSFDVPGYHFWLQQPAPERITQLTQWLSELKMIQTAVNLTLRLVRQSSAPQLQVAREGFYQTALDAQAPCQLIRVSVAHDANVYPEISVGRHGVSVRFYTLSPTERPMQTKEEVQFHLTTCIF